MKRLAIIGLIAGLVSCSKPLPSQPQFIMSRTGDGLPKYVYSFRMDAFPTQWTHVIVWAELRSGRDGAVVQTWDSDEAHTVSADTDISLSVECTDSNLMVRATQGTQTLFLATPRTWRSTYLQSSGQHNFVKADTDLVLLDVLEHGSNAVSSGQQLVVKARVSSRKNDN